MVGKPDAQPIAPTPFRWHDPASIKPREWLYGHHLIKKFVSATIAPGGVGKSTLTTADAVALASGQNLVGLKPHAPARVWLWNGEDPREELDRRVIATCRRHRVEPRDIAGRLFLDSGRDLPIKIGSIADRAVLIARPVVDDLIAAIEQAGIDVLIIDPFVSVHSLPENDNGAMDAAVKAFAMVAHETGCAIDLVHHSRKLNGADADMDSARGGSAIAAAVRSARALNPMNREIAKSFGISEQDRCSYVRIDNAKANLAPATAARWFKITSEPLGNGTQDRPEDWVAVAEPWSPPDALEGITADDLYKVQIAIHNQCYRAHVQADNWVGHTIGSVLGLNSHVDPDRQKIKSAIKTWLATGALVVQQIPDDRARPRPVVDVGEWALPLP